MTLGAGLLDSTYQERVHCASLRNTCPNGFGKRTCVEQPWEGSSDILQDDMVEYNQCQATLKMLYELGIPGRVEEFAAYRILMLLHGLNRSGTHC